MRMNPKALSVKWPLILPTPPRRSKFVSHADFLRAAFLEGRLCSVFLAFLLR
jgi:hypothetical protein